MKSLFVKNFQKVIAITFLVALVLFAYSCKKKEKVPVDNEKLIQEKFLSALGESYVPNPVEIFQKENLGEGKYSIFIVPGKTKIVIRKGKNSFSGTTPKNIYLLGKGFDSPQLKNGGVIDDHSNLKKYLEFEVMNFPKDKIWIFEELNILAREYPLTIVQMEPSWNTDALTYEEFVDHGKGQIHSDPPVKFKVLHEEGYILVSWKVDPKNPSLRNFDGDKIYLFDKNRVLKNKR